MNILWFISYFHIAFGCDSPILEIVWIVSDRKKYELDLLLIPLEYQLWEWGYPRDPNSDRNWYRWGKNPRLGPTVVYHEPDETMIGFALNPPDNAFLVKIDYPKNHYWTIQSRPYRHIEHTNRNSWIEALLMVLYQTPNGPEKAAETSVEIGPWVRTGTGTWLLTDKNRLSN
jgi:hypothetical protein